MALVALQEIQASSGYIPPDAFKALSQATGLPEGDLRGIASFYSELRTTPPGRHRLCVCAGDSCAAMGSRLLEGSVGAYLGISPGGTTHDGRFSYDRSFCLGNCALSPAISVDGEVYGRCTPEGAVRHLEGLPDD